MKKPSCLIAASDEEILRSLANIASDSGVTHISRSDARCTASAVDMDYDIIILTLPLADEFGLDTAMRIRRSRPDSMMIILAPTKVYDEVCEKICSSGAIVLPKSASRSLIAGSVRTDIALRNMYDEICDKNKLLTEMVNEVRLVNRAKCVLIEYLRISESEAHKQLQKRAMDKRITLTEAAEDILKTYEYR